MKKLYFRLTVNCGLNWFNVYCKYFHNESHNEIQDTFCEMNHKLLSGFEFTSPATGKSPENIWIWIFPQSSPQSQNNFGEILKKYVFGLSWTWIICWGTFASTQIFKIFSQSSKQTKNWLKLQKIDPERNFWILILLEFFNFA